MCNNDLATMAPIVQRTSKGKVFKFDATFESNSTDGNDTSSGFSLSIMCECI